MVVAGFLAATIPPLTHSPLLLSYIAHTIGRSAVILVYISRLNFSLLLPTIFSQAAFLVVFLISNTLYSAVYFIFNVSLGGILPKTRCGDYCAALPVVRGGAFKLHPSLGCSSRAREDWELWELCPPLVASSGIVGIVGNGFFYLYYYIIIIGNWYLQYLIQFGFEV